MTKQPKKIKPKSAVIYNGPSLLDGSPIVVIAIVKSGNVKTGDMIQTHIIRADMHPMQASKTGKDYAICGNCKHRGNSHDNPAKKTAENRSCYVNLGQGPNQVFKAFVKGNYPQASPEQTQAIGHERMVRLGTYGDPAAVPASVWDNLLMHSLGHTGYTHQHDTNQPGAYTRAMYSADTPEEARKAQKKGYRTFRVIPVKQWTEHGKTTLLKNEILCPASKEAGYKSTCNACKLCTGSTTKAKSIAIVAHGSTAKHFQG
jgi:hypothetical protein